MKLRVEADNGSYDIRICSGLIDGLQAQGNYAVISDTNVAPIYAKHFDSGRIITIEPGEASKTLGNLGTILEKLLALGLNRSDTVIALGGGVVGDIAGFAASVYKRGARLVQVPTTLLAMVDSSVGGKTAVNLNGGKNMAGTFYQPNEVVIDTNALATLDNRQYAAGMAEVIKYAYIADEGLYLMLRENNFEIGQVIYDCCRIKAAYVKADPYDHGVRMQLNYGHTMGHAIENAAGYGNYLHGEAVAMGMVCAAKIGEALGISPKGLTGDTAMLVEKYGLPSRPDEYLLEHAVQLVGTDKKVEGGSINFVLIDKIGHAVLEKLTVKQISDILK